MKEKKKKVTFTIQGWGFCHESCKTDLAGHSATLRKVGPFSNGYFQRANAVKCNKKVGRPKILNYLLTSSGL